MIIEADGDGGWLLTGVDILNASVHLNREWGEDMWRHQFKHNPSPAFNRLRYMLNRQEGTATEIRALFTTAMGDVGQHANR